MGEFARLDQGEAADRLEDAIAVIDRLSRSDIVTFVSPLNQLSDGSHAALDEFEFRIISSEGTALYDYDATTFDFNVDEIVTLDRVVNDCDAAFAAGESTCIIILHPQDFATDGELDPQKYQLYLDVLAHYNTPEYTFLCFKDTLPEVEPSLLDTLPF